MAAAQLPQRLEIFKTLQLHVRPNLFWPFLYVFCLQYILRDSFVANSMIQYFEVLESFVSKFVLFSIIPIKTQTLAVQSKSTQLWDENSTTKQLPIHTRRPR